MLELKHAFEITNILLIYKLTNNMKSKGVLKIKNKVFFIIIKNKVSWSLNWKKNTKRKAGNGIFEL